MKPHQQSRLWATVHLLVVTPATMSIFLLLLFVCSDAADASPLIFEKNLGVDGTDWRSIRNLKDETDPLFPMHGASNQSTRGISSPSREEQPWRHSPKMRIEGDFSSLAPDSSNGAAAEDSCRVYLAPSTIPGAGLGTFAGRSFRKGDEVTPGDVVVPIRDIAFHNGGDDHENTFLWGKYASALEL